ncbi:cytochrome c oxidase assembly protein [Lentibacillus sediminis]|uniref:cytochrome c oxidase assembly protein n=1 Tax=Lentibacillus sediminis TaxID=1940529 RepID=UPI000C1BB5CB|nr:cytochrome c oxidase assembly protein [Lentibacillus sediminis]
MHGSHTHSEVPLAVEILLATPFLLMLMGYFAAAWVSARIGRSWPLSRMLLWTAGILVSAAAVAGPLADLAHADFRLHMAGHLLLGMLGPLLLVLGAPVTLLLRAFPVTRARQLTRLLRSRPLGFLSNPAITATLNIGGLWLLYTTNLFQLMHTNMLLYVLVHVHVFLAGYFFTVSIIYIDPIPHRRSYLYRAIVLILSLAAHGILSKTIYATPLSGVPAAQAETGGMIMYYGGDAVEVMVMIILCYHWYRAARPSSDAAVA